MFSLLCFLAAATCLGLFVLGVLFINYVCTPVAANDGFTRIINRSKREMEQTVYTCLGGLLSGFLLFAGLGFAGIFLG